MYLHLLFFKPTGRTLFNLVGVELEGPKGTFVLEDVFWLLDNLWQPFQEAMFQPLFGLFEFTVLSPFFARRAPEMRVQYQPPPNYDAEEPPSEDPFSILDTLVTVATSAGAHAVVTRGKKSNVRTYNKNLSMKS